MSKFIDNVKAISGYNAMHKAIMRDAFAHTADYSPWTVESKILDRLETGGFAVGMAAMIAPTAGAIFHPAEAIALGHAIDSLAAGFTISPIALMTPGIAATVAGTIFKHKIKKIVKKADCKVKVIPQDIALPTTIEDAAKLGKMLDEAAYQVRVAEQRLSDFDKVHNLGKTLGLSESQSLQFVNTEDRNELLSAHNEKQYQIRRIVTVAEKTGLLPTKPAKHSNVAEALKVAHG